MKRILVPIMIMAVICQFLPAFDQKDAKERVKEIKAWLPTYEYKWAYKIESEEALEKAILFIEEPLEYISSVRGLDQSALWRDIVLYQTFMYEVRKTKEGFYFYGQLCRLTATMSEGKVSIMTFVLLNCHAAADSELIADLYCRLLNSDTRMFIQYLSKEKNWKQVINEMATCNASDIKELLDKLGDSKFEKEFKEYLRSKQTYIRELVE